MEVCSLFRWFVVYTQEIRQVHVNGNQRSGSDLLLSVPFMHVHIRSCLRNLKKPRFEVLGWITYSGSDHCVQFVDLLSSCLRGFSLGSPVSTHSSRTCMLGEYFYIHMQKLSSSFNQKYFSTAGAHLLTDPFFAVRPHRGHSGGRLKQPRRPSSNSHSPGFLGGSHGVPRSDGI